MENTIQQYCNFRMKAGSILSGFVGIVLFFMGVFASKFVKDTSKYVLTQGTVTSGTITSETVKSSKYRYKTYFDVVYAVNYMVNDKTYSGSVKDRFTDFSKAKATLDSAQGSLKNIYYDPLDPTENAQTKGSETAFRWLMFGVSTLCLGYAVLAWILRDNMAMCAITTLGNIRNF